VEVRGGRIMSDHSRDDAQQVAEKFQEDIQDITDKLNTLNLKILRDGQEVQVRFYSEVFCDTVLTSRGDTETEIVEINHHCNHYGCDEMLEIHVKTNSDAGQGQIGIDNLTWNWNDEKEERDYYFGAVITYIDKSRYNARKAKGDLTMGNDYVHQDIKILDIPFRAGWIEEATLEPVSEYLTSDDFQDQLKLLSKVTHQVVIN
jgi:hypothetical protein